MQRSAPSRIAVERARSARTGWIAAIALVLLPGLPALGAAEPSFSAYSTGYPTGVGSRHVAIGDLNGDGKQDIVTANSSGTVSVLLGLGDGALQAHNDYPTGASPGQVTLADFDSDGRPDVATVNAEGTISILLSNGDGSLRPGTQLTNVGWRIGDVNGDGRPDLVALKDTTVWVRLGVGDGTFAPTTDSPIGLRATLATSGDLNLDGRLDLVTWKEDSLLVLLGNGDGSFSPGTPVPMADPDSEEWVNGLMLGDVNGDGFPDLALTVRGECFRGDCSGWLAVLLGNGDGTFGQAWASVGGDPFELVAIADVDGNGRTDVVSWNSGGMYVLVNRLDGVVEPRRVPIYSATLAIADLNGDARPDIVTANGGSAVSVAIGNGDLTFGSGFERSLSFSPDGVASGDLNGDGRVDLVAAYQTDFEASDSRAAVLLGDPTGGLTEAGVYDVGEQPRGLALGDLNGDHRLDLAVASARDWGDVSVLMGDGNGGFGTRIAVPTGPEPYKVVIGDLDRDGHGDLVVLGYWGMNVLLGHGDGTFDAPSVYTTPFGAVEIADLDGDGVLDLALGNPGALAVSVMLGDGAGSFLPRTDMVIGQAPGNLTLGDVNGDEKLDIVATTQDSAWPLLGDGHGGFALTAAVPSGSFAGPPAIGDLNDDGAADLAFATGESLVKVLWGAQDGTFGTSSLSGTGGFRPRWVGIGDRNGDGREDLTVTNGGIMEYDSYPEGSYYRGVGASVSVLYKNGPTPSDSLPLAPIPAITIPAFWHPDTIVLGQTFNVTLTARNDGLISDDGRLSVSFPSFTDPSDGQWVSATASGDLPGYSETAAGGTLADNTCSAVSAAYLTAVYADSDWRGQSIESNTATITVQPRAAGPFHMYVRSTMHRAGGASCDLVNGLPVVGEEGYVDQQGWPVRRLTVMVSPPPPAPEPKFIGTIAPVPEWIGLGQSFSFKVVVRNLGAASDDGRIVVGFPGFTSAADSQQVTSLSVGDSPGYREIAAGAATTDSTCLPTITPHLMVEYADADWLWLGGEADTLTLNVRPTELGTFYFDVRSTMHMSGGAPCENANAFPAGSGAAITDPLGWTVRRFAVTVVPAPPQPTFVGDVVLGPPSVVTLGGTFTLTATATNSGLGSNDGRISVSFPNLNAASDSQWVSAGGGDDLPGYREFPAGATIQRKDCSSMTAGSLTVEYGDDGWSGAGAESNALVLTVRPQVPGLFYIYVRSTMRWNEALTCTYINGVPGNGTPSTDQQGWTVKRFQIQVVPPAPAPVFVAPVTGVPTAMPLGESFRLTAIVRNDGPLSDDGRITIGFPTLTQAVDSVWVTSGSVGDQPGYIERVPGSMVPDTQCHLIPAGHLVAEYSDAAWATGEIDTFAVTVQPQVAGTFYIDVRSTLRDVADTRGNCGYVFGIPTNGSVTVIDQQGWVVRRFTVVVNGPSGTPPPPTASWEQIVVPPGGPSARAGASAVFHPGRNAMLLYGGVDPMYRDEVWSLPLATEGAWSLITPGGTRPQLRTMHSMVYNPFDDQLVIFGGLYSGLLNDVTIVTLTGLPWWFPNSGHGTPPVARGGHTAVYDPVRSRMLVIGGWGGAMLNDVWEYAPAVNGTWRQLAPVGTPMPGRVQHVAVYDPVRDRVIVIGGDGGTFLNDVWALNLSGEPAWEHIIPTGTPPSPRREHTAIYDPVGDRIILYGGFDGARRGDLWSLSLGGTPAWALLTSATASPANRSGHAAIYDAPRRRMVVFGGELGSRVYSSEIWALSFDTVTPVAVSLASTDVNPDRVKLTWSGDGLAGLRSVLYRATSRTGEWVEIGAPASDSDDRLVFEDREVLQGTEYGYRLVVWQGAEETTLDPVWVTVPRRAILHLTGASPNPSPRGVMVKFSLAGDHPATLELFDLKGRRMASREVGSLGAGDHLVSLSDRPDLPAGIYLVRLTQDQRALTAKACIVK